MGTEYTASSHQVSGGPPSGSIDGSVSLAPPNGTFTNTTIFEWPPIPANPGRSLQPDIIACAVITWLISVTFVGLRFYTRGKLNNVLGPSDWCIIPALLCAAGVTASSIEQTVRGAGKHAWELDFFSFPALERAAWYGMLFYNLSLIFTRISILLLFRRIFTYSWAKKAIQVALILVTASGIWLAVSVLTACVPLEAFWDWSMFWKTPVYCQPGNIWWANAAVHIASDVIIMALPIPLLSTLKLPRRQKIALVGVFVMGFFVCIVSALRLVALVDVYAQKSFDVTYTSSNMIFWTSVEINGAIVAACIMTLKPLIQRAFPRLLSPSNGTRDQSLQWITPVNGTFTGGPGNRFSHQSFNGGRPASYGHSHGHGRVQSVNFKRRSFGLPRVSEHEGTRGGDDIAFDEPFQRRSMGLGPGDDLEAQRTCSVSSVGMGACDDDVLSSSGDFCGDGALRAPPKAHLRLSIRVTKSVHVEKYPRSPTFGTDDDDDEDDDVQVRSAEALLRPETLGGPPGRTSAVAAQETASKEEGGTLEGRI